MPNYPSNFFNPSTTIDNIASRYETKDVNLKDAATDRLGATGSFLPTDGLYGADLSGPGQTNSFLDFTKLLGVLRAEINDYETAFLALAEDNSSDGWFLGGGATRVNALAVLDADGDTTDYAVSGSTAAITEADGVALTLNDWVLVINHGTPALNGMWQVTNVSSTTEAWTQDDTAVTDTLVYVEQGTLYNGQIFVLGGGGAPGTDPVTTTNLLTSDLAGAKEFRALTQMNGTMRQIAFQAERLAEWLYRQNKQLEHFATIDVGDADTDFIGKGRYPSDNSF